MLIWTLVLAGGASRRMGMDKLSLSRTGRPGESTILSHVVQVAEQVSHHVRILGPKDGLIQRCEVDGPRLDVIPDIEAWMGPLQAIARGWPDVQEPDFVSVVAGDLPGVNPQVLTICQQQLAGSADDVDGVVVVREGRVQPLLGCYRWRTKTAWTAALEAGESRLMRVMDGLHLSHIDADKEDWPKWWTRPVHTPEDYTAWITDKEVQA